MTMDLGPHAIFIWSCYAAAFIVLTATILWLWLDGRRLMADIELIEARDAHRSDGKQR